MLCPYHQSLGFNIETPVSPLSKPLPTFPQSDPTLCCLTRANNTEIKISKHSRCTLFGVSGCTGRFFSPCNTDLPQESQYDRFSPWPIADVCDTRGVFDLSTLLKASCAGVFTSHTAHPSKLTKLGQTSFVSQNAPVEQYATHRCGRAGF